MTRLKGRHWSCITTFNKIDRDGAFSFERHLSDLDYQYQKRDDRFRECLLDFTSNQPSRRLCDWQQGCASLKIIAESKISETYRQTRSGNIQWSWEQSVAEVDLVECQGRISGHFAVNRWFTTLSDAQDLFHDYQTSRFPQMILRYLTYRSNSESPRYFTARPISRPIPHPSGWFGETYLLVMRRNTASGLNI